MRILQLIDSLNVGGAERMAVNISNVLNREGYSVMLCSSRSGGELKNFLDENCQYFCLNKKSVLDFRAFVKLVRIVKKNKINLIHAHSSSIYWAAIVKLLCRNVKIIWHDHLGKRLNENYWINLSIRVFSRKIDSIIAVNSELKEWAIENLKIESGRIFYIKNFPSIKQYKYKINSTRDTFDIVYLANIKSGKGHIVLLEAFEILFFERGYNTIRLKLAGYYCNDDCYIRINEFINLKQLNDFVEIMGIVLNTSTLLAQSDIGVISSFYEGLPVSLLEYGLAGLPVVVTNVGQCAEVVGNGKFGTVVPASKPKELADALEWHIQNRTDSINLGAKFKQHVEQNYGSEKFIQEYLKVLNTL